MKIYYYHTRPIASALKEWKEHTHPGHILYGLTHFPKNGIDPVLHPYKHFTSRWKLMWYNLHAILRCKENYDVVYGTSYRGLELLIFLRALGLFRKPIAVWHHQAVPQSKGWLKNLLSRLFYKGIDCMFFFSKALIDDSLKTGKVKEKDMYLIHWGADLDFYDACGMRRKTKSSSLQERKIEIWQPYSSFQPYRTGIRPLYFPSLTVTRNMRKSPTGFKGKTISIST